MPKVRPVVLDYDKNNPSDPFRANPPKVPVAPNDTVQFRIGDRARAEIDGCKLQITLEDARHFSAGTLRHSAGQTGAEDLVLSVLPVPAADLAASAKSKNNVITRYECQLLRADGSPIPELRSKSGGEIIPDSGNTEN